MSPGVAAGAGFQGGSAVRARFRQQFLDDERIRIPAVVWEQSTRRVLCLDYLPGIKVNDREALLEAGIDPSAVAEIGAASYLKQLVRFGFFHADPHPATWRWPAMAHSSITTSG